MFLFQHLKDNVPLFSAILVSDEISSLFLTVFVHVLCPFSSDCFQDFPFIFVFSMLTMMCLCMVFFILILLGVLWHWICGLISFISFGKFLAISSIFVLFFFLLLRLYLCWTVCCCPIELQCWWVFSLFSLFIFQSPGLLILSSIFSLLLSTSKSFFIYNIIYFIFRIFVF